MPEWKHRVQPDPAHLPETPPETRPEQAQPWCNFVVWTPYQLPPGCLLSTGTLRMESPPGRVDGHTVGRTPWGENNPAAYRCEVAGTDRRLRVKEFLYDWAFPALDHPCLWESQTRATPIDDRYVLWYGVDYMQKPAASARLARTTIELSVLAGEFSDDEILQLYRSLRPADPAAAAAIAATPFAALSYWARRQDAVNLSVPVGLWTFRRLREHHSDWSSGAAAQRVVTELGLPLSLGGFGLDSAGRFRDNQGRAEIEAVYAGGSDRGHELRIIAQRQGQGSLQVPAEPEASQPGVRERTMVDGVEVQLAWIDERYGPFQAVLARADIEATLLSSTGVGLDRTWFLAAVATLVNQRR